MNTKYIVPVLALAIAGSGTASVARVSASTNTSTGTSLVQKIAQKFGLQESEVQAVFDQDRAEHHAKMQEAMVDRLSEAVTAGKLTEEQKQKILDKQKQLQSTHEANREKFQSMTHEERHAEMQKLRTNLEQWAKENGIDAQYLQFGIKAGHKGMPGKFMHHI